MLCSTHYFVYLLHFILYFICLSSCVSLKFTRCVCMCTFFIVITFSYVLLVVTTFILCLFHSKFSFYSFCFFFFRLSTPVAFHALCGVFPIAFHSFAMCVCSKHTYTRFFACLSNSFFHDLRFLHILFMAFSKTSVSSLISMFL